MKDRLVYDKQIKALYDDIDDYTRRYFGLPDDTKQMIDLYRYIYAKHHDGSDSRDFEIEGKSEGLKAWAKKPFKSSIVTIPDSPNQAPLEPAPSQELTDEQKQRSFDHPPQKLQNPDPKKLFKEVSDAEFKEDMRLLKQTFDNMPDFDSASSGMMTAEQAMRSFSKNLAELNSAYSRGSSWAEQVIPVRRQKIVRKWNINLEGFPAGPDGKLTEEARREIFAALKREQPELVQENENELMEALKRV